MLMMSPRTIAMALAAALTGCGVIEDDRPTIARAAEPAAQGVVIEDLPALGPAPSVAVPPASGSTDRSAMGYGSTYRSTYSGAYLGRYGAAHKDAGAVVFYGFGSVYNSSVLYRGAYGYRTPYAHGLLRPYPYASPYGAYPYRHPSLYGYGNGRGFAHGRDHDGFYRHRLRTVEPIEKDRFIIDAGSKEEAFAALDRVMRDQGYELRRERANGQRVYVGRDRIKGNDVFYVSRLNVNEKRRGFAVKLQTSIRPRDPTIHDRVGRLAGRRYERALEDESRLLRKQLKRANPAPSSVAVGLAPASKATGLLSTPTKVKKVKQSRAVILEPQRMKAKKGIIASPRRAENRPQIQAPTHRRSEGGGFRQAGGGKRERGAGKLVPLR